MLLALADFGEVRPHLKQFLKSRVTP